MTIIAISISLTSNAATITQTFSTTVSFGEFAGSVGTGSFTYDPANIGTVTANGDTCSFCITGSTGLEITLNIFGQNFTEIDNDTSIATTIFPFLQFDSSAIDATPIALDFLIQETNIFFPEDGNAGLNLVPITQEGVLGIWVTDLSIGSNGFDFEATTYVNGAVSAVPVPAAVWLFSSGLIGLVSFATRKKL